MMRRALGGRGYGGGRRGVTKLEKSSDWSYSHARPSSRFEFKFKFVTGSHQQTFAPTDEMLTGRGCSRCGSIRWDDSGVVQSGVRERLTCKNS